MAKGKAKKSNVKEQSTSQPDINKKSIKTKKNKKNKTIKVAAKNAVPAPPPAPAPEALPGPSQVVPCAPVTNVATDASKGKEKVMNKVERSSGFIFMCNQKTKPECFRYRVFGLPAGKREVAEKIKEGAKLFLFDFDVKLLYGVYKATCQGQMNLEASAFGGRFPAQVKFSIYKDCIPLPESVFKSAIKDNYHGSKFEPVLNAKQVRSLLLLFRSCDGPTAPPGAPYVVREPPRQDAYHHHLARLPPPLDPYLSQLPYSNRLDVGPMVEHNVPEVRHEYYGSAGSMSLAPSTMKHQGMPDHPSDRYYAMEPRHPYFPDNSSHFGLDRYPRYGGIQEMVPRGVETHRSPLGGERGGELLQATVARYYNSSETRSVPNNTYPPAAASYHMYPSTAPSHAQALMYPPRGAESPTRSVPVSSYYSFSGVKQMYR